MKVEKIKPIPKYMLKVIHKYDQENYKNQDGHTRFYAYLTKNDGELVKVTVAVRNYYKKWLCKQVAVHGIHSDKCFAKDIMWNPIAGYNVGWYAEGIGKYEKWYEDGEWGYAADKYLDPWAVILNQDYLEKLPAYKYSGYQYYPNPMIIQYLRFYERHPICEYILKLGLHQYVMRKSLVIKLEKDKQFRKWVIANKDVLANKQYYIPAILSAYKKKLPIEQMQSSLEMKKRLMKNTAYTRVKTAFNDTTDKLIDYLTKQNATIDEYDDYIEACNYLGLDMTLPKNRIPHDLKRWHDIRIDEYRTAKALKDAELRKELYAQFAQVAEKYLALQWSKDKNYITLIAHSPADLIREGEMLSHCVGRMNYDQRVIKEQSLIFFIRTQDNPDAPLVTIEYSLSAHKVLQCYGYRDSRPSEDIQHYVYHQWLPYANKKIKKIAA